MDLRVHIENLPLKAGAPRERASLTLSGTVAFDHVAPLLRASHGYCQLRLAQLKPELDQMAARMDEADAALSRATRENEACRRVGSNSRYRDR